MDAIRTPRLLLRPARADDLAPMHRILSDPRAMRYWSTLPHASVDETREWLEAMIAPEEERFDFIVEHDGAAIGKAGFYRLPEIGYILHPDRWGQGLATEALTAVIEHAFRRFELPAIKADIDPRNDASIGLLKRLGFVEAGRAARTWLIGEEWCDSVYFELKRPAG